MYGVAVVVHVRLAPVLLGRIGMLLVLVSERGVIVLVGVGGELMLGLASMAKVVGDVHVLMVVHDRVVVMRIHPESSHWVSHWTWQTKEAPRAAPLVGPVTALRPREPITVAACWPIPGRTGGSPGRVARNTTLRRRRLDA